MKRFRDEIQQSRPFHSPAVEAFLNLQRTAWALRKEVVDHLRPRGLTIPQYNVLRILRGAGDDGLTCQEIGRRMVTPDSDVTRLVDRGEAQGTMTRSRCTKDRRVVHITITSAGLDILAAEDDDLMALHRSQLAHLRADEMDALNLLLDKTRHRGGDADDRETETDEGETK